MCHPKGLLGEGQAVSLLAAFPIGISLFNFIQMLFAYFPIIPSVAASKYGDYDPYVAIWIHIQLASNSEKKSRFLGCTGRISGIPWLPVVSVSHIGTFVRIENPIENAAPENASRKWPSGFWVFHGCNIN